MTAKTEPQTRGPDRRQSAQRTGSNPTYQGPDRRIADRRQQERRTPAS